MGVWFWICHWITSSTRKSFVCFLHFKCLVYGVYELSCPSLWLGLTAGKTEKGLFSERYKYFCFSIWKHACVLLFSVFKFLFFFLSGLCHGKKESGHKNCRAQTWQEYSPTQRGKTTLTDQRRLHLLFRSSEQLRLIVKCRVFRETVWQVSVNLGSCIYTAWKLKMVLKVLNGWCMKMVWNVNQYL